LSNLRAIFSACKCIPCGVLLLWRWARGDGEREKEKGRDGEREKGRDREREKGGEVQCGSWLLLNAGIEPGEAG
jgi:hypothetical protein